MNPPFHIPSAGKRDVYYFTVVGVGEFPLDMLRYDSAFPAGSDDTDKIVARYGDAGTRRNLEGAEYDPTLDPMSRREVRLGCVQRGGPTIGRWASFGWYVQNPELED